MVSVAACPDGAACTDTEHRPRRQRRFATLRSISRIARPVRAAVMCLFVTACERGASTTEMRDAQLALGTAAYPSGQAADCDPVRRDGPPGRTNGIRSRDGVGYVVRTPSNYDARLRHPLLMVFAPAATDAETSERVAALTMTATSSGYVVAYADHIPLGPRGAKVLGRIPGEIGARWCIDPQRVFLTGHSDGGTVAEVVAVDADSRDGVAGIAPSAAGIVASDLSGYGCRTPIPVMVMHSRDDTWFPGFGEDAARWWAACNGCAPGNPEPGADGCRRFANCRAPTVYCEARGPHIRWAGRGEAIVNFFAERGRR